MRHGRTDRIVSRVVGCLIAFLVFALLPLPHAEHNQPPPPPPPRLCCPWGVKYLKINTWCICTPLGNRNRTRTATTYRFGRKRKERLVFILIVKRSLHFRPEW